MKYVGRGMMRWQEKNTSIPGWAEDTFGID